MSSDHNEHKETQKRQNVESPSVTMSPSIRAPSKKMFRSFETPKSLAHLKISQVDPNIDATLLECSSIEKSEISSSEDCFEQNTEQVLSHETSANDGIMSPGMSDDMKAAIEAYLNSTSQPSVSHHSEIIEANGSNNISAVDVLNQDEENPVVSITFASETAEDFVNTRKSDTSVTGSQITDVGFYGDIRDIKDESSISTSFAEESVFSQREQEEMTSSIIPVLNEMETETEVTASTASGNSKNLTLSSLKKKVTLKWHSKLDDLSSPRELADYIRDRTEVFSFIINENFCETSTFCENCYAMRMDMEMLSEKFERLTHTTGRKVNGEKTELCVDDLQNSLNEKESEISLLVASVLKLTKENEQLIEENEFAKKDAENRKLIFEESLNKSNEEIIMLKQKLFNSEVSLAALKEEKSKPCTEDISLVKKYQTTEHMEQELEKAHRMLEDNAIKIKELENERQKDAEERKELLAKFEQALINLDVARSSRVEAIERGHTSAICSLEAKIAELSSKIDESNHRREEELLKQKSFLTETLNSLLAQIKNDVKDKYNSDWDLEDIESSLTYFEKALDIISHGASQFELLVQVVAERRMAAEGHLKQLRITMEEAVEDKKKYEALILNEKLKLNNIENLIMAEFSNHRKCFFNSLQESNEKCSQDLKEFQGHTVRTYANIENLSAYMKTGMGKINDNIENLNQAAEKIHTISTLLLDHSRKYDAYKSLEISLKSVLESMRNELIEYRNEQNNLKNGIEYLQNDESELKSKYEAALTELDSMKSELTQLVRDVENLSVERQNLVTENTEFKDIISKFDIERSDFEKMKELLSEQSSNYEESKRMLKLLENEKKRLEKACDSADDEISGLKQQIFDLLRKNARLETELHGEGEEAVNRRLGYIEPPVIHPKINSSFVEVAQEAVSPTIPAEIEAKFKDSIYDFNEAAPTSAHENHGGKSSRKTESIENQSCKTS